MLKNTSLTLKYIPKFCLTQTEPHVVAYFSPIHYYLLGQIVKS